MKKKLISLLLAVVMVLSVMPLTFAVSAATASPEANDVQSATPTTDTDWYDNETGDDTPDVLYIYNEDDFMAFATKLASQANLSTTTYFSGKVIHIMADLNMKDVPVNKSTHSEIVHDTYWKGVIKRGRYFDGIIDGHGHTIENLTYAGESTNNGNTYAGLLGGIVKAHSKPIDGYDGAYAGVFNLNFSNCQLSVAGQYSGGLFGAVESSVDAPVVFKNLNLDINVTGVDQYMGGIFGYLKENSNCKIENVYCDGTITQGVFDKTTTAYAHVGGFMGGGEANTKNSVVVIDSSVFAGTINIQEETAQRIGGFAGEFKGGGTGSMNISNSAFYGTINGGVGYVSGIVGIISSAITADKYSITNCIVAGSINPNSVTNCTNITNVTNSSAKLTYKNNIFDGNQYGDKATDALKANGINSTGRISTDSEFTAYTLRTSEALKVITTKELCDLGMTEYVAITNMLPLPVAVVKYFASEINSDTVINSTSIEGYQTTDYVDSKCDLRLIGLVHGENTAYDAVGFEFVIVNEAGATRTNVVDGAAPAITTVYTSVLEPDINTATGEQKTDPETGEKLYVSTSAETLGGDYIFVTTISPMVANKGIVTVIVKSFHDVGDARVYDDIMVINFDTTVNS